MTSAATIAVFVVLLTASLSLAQESPADQLARDLTPFLDVVSGRSATFRLEGRADVSIDGRSQTIELQLERFDNDSFNLALTHQDYSVAIRRRATQTAFALPHHRVVFLGAGQTDAADHLTPALIIDRLTSSKSNVAAYAPLLAQAEPAALAALLTSLASLTFDAEAGLWRAGPDVRIEFKKEPTGIRIAQGETTIALTLHNAGTLSEAAATDDWPGFSSVVIPRPELERQLVRGVRRATEILAPSPLLTQPPQRARKVPNGELRWIDGQRVALLHGTPEQVGVAHGKLLKDEALRCIDSVLNTFGTAQTIRTGRWFRHDLESAYERLSPHIPEDHKRETRAMASAIGIDERTAEVLNVFPELFHCSGFAVFGSATTDGRLYHGRVLDYMTTIGLQDAATTLIVAVDGKIPFANVGYGGFIGSVSGMNAQEISLGEMGGRGEGQWDGVPMATLMRRAPEECETLDAVMELWKSSPRTCEYYYVFADGKSNRAVGVAATPESVEFILPGQAHPRLGEGIPDAVVLSAGSRLEKLRERVTERHGTIDVETAKWLMSRPVAMQSNLHNVLFVPHDGVLYVANADHKHPAAERPYVRLDLRQLLREIPAPVDAAASR